MKSSSYLRELIARTLVYLYLKMGKSGFFSVNVSIYSIIYPIFYVEIKHLGQIIFFLTNL